MVNHGRGIKKASDEDIARVYAEEGSIWRAGAKLGIAGQTVHERLIKLGIRRKHQKFSLGQDAFIRRWYQAGLSRGDGGLDELCRLLGRPKTSVSRRARQLGLTTYHWPMHAKMKKAVSKRSKKWIQECGHPKGMLGKKHSPETLQVLADKSREMWKDPNHKLNSPEHRQAISDRMSKMAQVYKTQNAYSRAHHGWVSFAGGKRYFMRSRWEMNYAAYLEWLLSKKEIKSWEYEAETFWFEAIRRGVRSYTPDFKVFNNDGSIEYHEVKGWMDGKSRTKLRRMRIYHPDVSIVLIDADQYKAISRFKALVPNWQ